jgi:hypothetical protein
MSYDGLEDKDLPLKLRLMSLLWNLGWTVRPNVKLIRYQEGKRTKDQFTDIDVLAIKFLPLQDQIVAVSSAKSGKESDSSELFWLSGVKSYFGASLAYYIRPQANTLKTRALCDRLGIIALNEEQLALLEQRFSLPQDYGYFSINMYQEINKCFTELKDAKPGLYWYITEKFWTDPIHNQLLRSITAIKDINKLDLSVQTKIVLKYYLIALSALPIYRLAHQLVSIPEKMIGEEVKTCLMGGETARGDKEQIIKSFKYVYDLALTKNPGIASPEFDSVFSDIFRLDFFKDLLDLLIRVIENYRYAIYTSRMVDVLVFQVLKKPEVIPDLRLVSLPDLRKEDWETAAKLAKDLLIFYQRIGAMEKTEIKL